MELEHSFKRAGITIVGLVALLSMAAAAQEIRSEISVQGTGFFAKNSQGNGVRNHAEETGGFLVGYGGGADYVFTSHWSLRTELRSLVYKTPSFNLANLDTNTWTHAVQPSAGIVFRF